MKWLVVAVLVVGGVRAADACSPPPPYAGRTHHPEDGAAGVATNAAIHIAHEVSPDSDAEDALLRDVIVRTAAGDPVTTTIANQGGRVFVSAAWAPNTTYEVLDRLQEDCQGSSLEECTRADHAVFLTFTTGDGPDITPPLLGGTGSTGTPSRDICDNSGCCGPHDVFAFDVQWDAAEDESTVFYDVYRVLGEDESPVQMWNVSRRARSAIVCSGDNFSFDIDFLSPNGGTLVVRATDLAGNSATTELSIALPTVDCSPLPPDAGPDAAVSPSSSDGGCSIAAPATSGAGGLILLSALIAAARFRTPRRREP